MGLPMLYLVPTPLGNLEDITQRALRVLREVKAIYCEDTRRTRVLLSHFGIRAPALRYDDHNTGSVERIVAQLKAGETLALVSDSGTPVISDPGIRIVARAREENIPVVSLPGPSAIAAAVAGSGLPGDSFVFLGFLPRSDSKRRKALESAAALGRTMAIYESPHRVLDLLGLAKEVLGSDVRSVVVRELSKVYEEWVTGTLEQVTEKLHGREKILGEFVVLIHPNHGKNHQSSAEL
jgi:16S rRNA (cytidine1402-2'-O)-methyltransferase